MPRLIPYVKLRPVAISIICLISLAALTWPAVSAWASLGHSGGGGPVRTEANGNDSRTARPSQDLLTRLVKTGKPAAFKQKAGGAPLLGSQMAATANMLAPNVTASLVDSIFTDVDGDGRADPGDTLQYTLTVNNATDPATGMKINVPLDPNLTLVPGSVNTSPIAFDDTAYTATGNVRITVNAANGVLVNDIDPDTQNNTGLTASAGATSTNGGNVAMSADGSFSYNPAPGFTGTDTFTYTVTDAGGATGTGTVTFNVSGLIWFINDDDPTAGGDGRITNPFNCLVGAGCFDQVAADDPGDNIFLLSGAYTGGLTLLNNQRFIGQGATAPLVGAGSITGITVPTGSDALPPTGGISPSITTTAAATDAITLGQGNLLRGFNIGNTTDSDIAGSNFGALTMSEITLSGTGRALDLATGTFAAAASINSITVDTSATNGISLQGITGANGLTIGSTTITSSTTQGILVGTSAVNISFGNTSIGNATAAADPTDAISLQNNSAGTRTFGTLSIQNNTGVGILHAVGGGALTVTGATTITNPGGRGIDIQDSTTAISFQNANVTQSGGTGVFVDDTTGAVSFADLDISPDAAQRGLHVTDHNTGTLTTTTGTITTTTTGIPLEVIGTSTGSRAPLALVFESVSANGSANGIVLQNTSGTFAVNGTGTTAGSGGTIQNITNRGASFIDSGGITLKNMNLTNVGTTNGADPTNANSTCGGLETGLGGNLGCNAGIHLVNVTGATFDRVVLSGGVQQGVNINNVTTFTMTNSSVINFGDQTREDGFRIKNLLGTNTLSNTTVTGNEEIQMRVVNTSGTLTAFNVTGGSFSNSAAPNGVDGIQFEGSGTAVMNINVQGATMNNNAADGFFSSATDTATVNVTVQGCTINGNINAAVNVNAVSGGNSRFTIGGAGGLGNTINGGSTQTGNFININLGLPSTGTLQGTVNNNNITGSTAVGAGGTGIRVVSNGSGTLTTAVTNNTVTNANGEGINALARDGNSTLNVTFTGNNVTHAPTNDNHVVTVNSGAVTTDTTNVCADIGGAGGLANTINDGNPGISHAIRVRNRFAGTLLRLPGYGGGGTDTAAVVAYLQARNNETGTVTATINGNTITGGGGCPQPTARMSGEEFAASSKSSTDDMMLAALDQTAQPILNAAIPESLDTRLYGAEWASVKFAPISVEASRSANAPAPHTGATSAAATENNSLSNHATATSVRHEGDAVSLQHNAQDETLRKGRRPETNVQVETHEDKDAGTDGIDTVTVGGANGFTLPAGKSITVTFRATINNPQPSMTQVSTQGTVSGMNFANVLTDDPDTGTPNDPTITNIDHTTVAISSNATPAVFGQNITFTATMTGVPTRASDPPGTVQFKADGNNIGAAVPVVIGTAGDNVSTAQASISTLSVGNHVITAEYSGGGAGATKYNANIGTLSPNQVVGQAGTTTGLTSSQNPSVFGQPVTFTATVSVTAPGAGSPTGSINFLDGGNPITGCQNVALQSGQAQCQPGSLSVGNHTITTTYSGDTNFSSSNGNLTGNPQVVNKADTSVGLTSSQNPAPQGTNITFTATIAVTSPGAGAPSGTVQFLDGMNPIAGCTAQTIMGNQATCQTNALTVGNHTITAQYSGDGSFNTSTGSLTGNPQVITGPPTLTPTVGLTRMQATPASNSQIATVSDDVAMPGNITVTAQTVPMGMTITNIVNTNGTITADIAAGCGTPTGDNTIVLKATDGKSLESTSNLVINVVANAQPTLGSYANSTIVTSCKLVLVPTAAPSDNGSIQTVTGAGSMGFTGNISVDATTGVVTITDSNPVGMHTITITATDDCGATNTSQFTLQVTAPPTAPTEYDFDGDRKADVAVYRPGATVNDFSYWFILKSTDNTVQITQFGHDGDVLVPGDYDGDGDTEVAVFRPGINTWFTSQDPMTNYGAVLWGSAGDIPVPGRWDNDAKTDIAVWRPSEGNWYIIKSTGGTEVRSWGTNGDKPVPADYDGDGMMDAAIWRPSVSRWFIQKSGGGTVVENWGDATDLLVPADYDGDNKDDMAVFRPSTGFWYIIQSGGGTRTEQWGQTGDVPVAADYDNDGKADLSVYRPGEGAWYIFSSCPCTLKSSTFGVATDKPVPSAFTPPAGP